MKNLILLLSFCSIILLSYCDKSTPPASSGSSGGSGSTTENPPVDPDTSPDPFIVPDQEVMTRPAISSLAPDGPELMAYKRAINVMKSRPASDPTSWAYQAAIHGSTEQPARRAWNNCQHQSYFFLSWHRMYLYFFERIAREASGDSTFVVPYWDYTTDDQRFLPEAFRVPANNSNPLYIEQRNQGVNDGFQLPASATDFEQAFSFDNFTSPPDSPLSFGGQRIEEAAHFGGRNGQIEQVPHNVMHVVVGGWMMDANFAALDPIFWCHHANIDRLWNKWIRENPVRSNPVDDDLWMNQVFEFFDENGQLVTMTGKDIINTVEQLGYKYDDDQTLASNNTDDPVIVSAQELPPTDIQNLEPMKKEIILHKDINLEVSDTKTSIPVKHTNKSKNVKSNESSGAKPSRFVLNLEHILYDDIPTGYYEVYINLPENISNPDYKSIYFAGSMGFFGHAVDPNHSHHGGHGKNANFEITKLITNQMKEGIWDYDNLNLTFFLRGSVIAPDGASQDVLERIKPNGNIKIGKMMLERFE